MRYCPVCNDRDAEVLHKQKFFLPAGHPLPTEYDVLCCNHCGMIYAAGRATQDDYDTYYTEMSKYATGGMPSDPERQAEAAHRIVPYIHPKDAIVDIGCGSGTLVKNLRDRGFSHTVGIDPSQACCDTAHDLSGANIFKGTIYDIPPTVKFDMVILSHVLEHIFDVEHAFKVIAQVAADKLYIECPDASRYKDFIDAPYQDLNVEHINHFTPGLMDRLAYRFQFEVLAAGSHEIAQGMTRYPCFWRVYHRPAVFKKQMMTYLQMSRWKMQSFDRQIYHQLHDVPSIHVWGTGQLLYKLLLETCLQDKHILSFVDNNPANIGKSLAGVEIISPDKLVSSDTPILITTLLRYDEIAEDIRRRGLRNPIVGLQEKNQDHLDPGE